MKNNFKRFLVVLLALTMLLAMATACSSNGKDSGSGKGVISVPSDDGKGESAAPDQGNTPDVPDNNGNGDNEGTASGGDQGYRDDESDDPDDEKNHDDERDEPSNAEDLSIEEAVIYNENGITVTATELVIDDGWTEIMVHIENNSDRNITIFTDGCAINGYMADDAMIMYVDIPAGKKAKDSISIDHEYLDVAGISTIAEFQFFLDISDSDTFDTLYRSELITLYTSEKDYVQTRDDSGTVLYEDSNFKLVFKGFANIYEDYASMLVYVENNSGQSVRVSFEDVSIDGYMYDGSLWEYLREGTAVIGTMGMEFKEIGISSLDELGIMEFVITIADEETYDEILITDPIQLSFDTIQQPR